MKDDEILDLYWNRSETAIKETEIKYGGYCTTIALNILSNLEDSLECVNDAYFKLWNTIPPHRPQSLLSYLGKITRNISLNRYKAKHTQKRLANEFSLILDELEGCLPDKTDVEIKYEAKLINQSISKFMKSLNYENRVVFTRRYFYADSIKKISSRYNISESKIKSMLFRMRKQLKTQLEKEGVLA